VTFDPFAFPRAFEVIGHRGFAARAPENTLASLRMALEAGADAVECDIHTAGDGTPVLLHDETLERTTSGSGPVTARSVEELGELDAGLWFDSDFRGEPLPTLAGALATVGESGAGMYVEVKGVRRPDDLEFVVDAACEADMLERIVFISMKWSLLEGVRTLAPAALLGYIVEHPARLDAALERARGDPRSLIDFDARILLGDPSIVRRVEDASVPVAVWTVDTLADAKRLLELGVRRITTNQVERLVELRDGPALDAGVDDR